ncbi:MAG: DUF4358 domain-containing protein [Cellulosilyticaceae bacterium]
MKKTKKILISILLTAITFVPLTGCTNHTATSSIALKTGVTLQSIVDDIEIAIPLQMPAPLDETTLNDLFHIDPTSIEEYAGKFSMTMTSSDNVVAVKAKPGKVDEVKAALEKRKEDLITSFSQYLVDQLGKVIQKGDYIFLIIAGDAEKGLDKEMAAAEDIINNSFTE